MRALPFPAFVGSGGANPPAAKNTEWYFQLARPLPPPLSAASVAAAAVPSEPVVPYRVLARRAAVYASSSVDNFCRHSPSDKLEVPGKLYDADPMLMKGTNEAYRERRAAMAAFHAAAREAVAA